MSLCQNVFRSALQITVVTLSLLGRPGDSNKCDRNVLLPGKLCAGKKANKMVPVDKNWLQAGKFLDRANTLRVDDCFCQENSGKTKKI